MSITLGTLSQLSVPASGQRALVGAGPLGLVYRAGEQARKLLLHAPAEVVARLRGEVPRLPAHPALAPVRLVPEGGTWSAWTPFAPGEAVPEDPAAAADLLDGLAALHAAGLVHGHLSPPNVRRLGGAPALFDAALWGPPTEGIRAGSWQRFASPQRLAGAPPSPADDCFAFGRLLASWWAPEPTLAPLLEALCDPDPAARPGAAEAAAELRALGGLTAAPRDVVDAPPEEPERYGPFRVVRTLGRGGMGVVHLAVHERRGEVVALKTVTGASPRMRRVLRWECACLADIEEPGVARLVDHGEQHGTPWYAMELVRGEPLRAWMRRPPWSLLGPLALLCDTLAALHAQGIVHGDLKPENVLVTDEGQPVLVDFGLAGITERGGSRERLSLRTEIAGSVPYMAPEQATSAPLDPRVDLYALGCLLYEVWAGRPPFVGPDAAGVLRQHREAIPQPLLEAAPGAPERLAALVDRLLEKRPERRPGYAADVAAALREAAGLPPAPRPPISWVYRPPLLEREAALAQLTTWLEHEGRPLVWIEGAGGLGKTRLAAALGLRLYAAGADVTIFPCEPGPARPLAPLLPALQEAADHLDAGADRRQVLGPLGHLLAAFHPALGDRPDAGIVRLSLVLRALCHLLTARRERRLVVVLGDAHHADDLTLAFLRHVAEQAPPGLQAVATWRGEERPPPLEALVGAAPGVTLAPLSPAAVDAAAAGMLGTDAAPEALCQALERLSGGNPFYVAEYLRTAAEGGHLTRAGDRWRFSRAGPGGALPDSIEGLLAARLGRVSPDATRIASALALLGVDATLERAAALAELTPARAFAAIRALRARGLLRPDGPLAFKHASNHDMAWRLLSPERQAAAHRRAAALLEGQPGVDRARVAGHWERGGEPARAILPYKDAAIERAQLGAFAQADALFARAVAAGGGARVRYDHARFVLYRIGRYEEALAAILRVLEGTEPGDPLRGRALGWEVQLLISLGRLDEAEARAGAALEALRLDSAEEHAAMLGTIAMMHSYRGRHTEALRCHQEALAVMDADPGPLQTLERAMVRSRMAGELRYLGETSRSLALEREALEALRALGDRFMEGIVLSNVGTALAELGDHEGCWRYLEESAEIHRETGNRSSLSVTLFNLGHTALRMGQPEQAGPYLEESRELGRAIGRVDVWADAERLLAEVAMETGRPGEAGPLVQGAIEAQREAGLLADLAGSFYTAARVARRVDGDPEAARELLRRMVEEARPGALLEGQRRCELALLALLEGGDPGPDLAAARQVLAESEGLHELAVDIQALERAIALRG
jgi:tetratricopeptide (TPR) repeat protein